MRRLQLVEIQDQPWCPAAIRDGLTEILQVAVGIGNHYAPALARLVGALDRCASSRVVDLCSGGGGPWPHLRDGLSAVLGRPVSLCLTDKYPNRRAFEWAAATAAGSVRYYAHPVDAHQVPRELRGVRTLFGSFHHFPPARARELLVDAVEAGQGIAVFEITQRSRTAILLMLLAPFLVLFFAPVARPLRWSRLLLTYVLPVLPLVALFDGLVSCLRTYNPEELLELAEGLEEKYSWESGEDREGPSPIPITFLVGVPSRPPLQRDEDPGLDCRASASEGPIHER